MIAPIADIRLAGLGLAVSLALIVVVVMAGGVLRSKGRQPRPRYLGLSFLVLMVALAGAAWHGVSQAFGIIVGLELVGSGAYLLWWARGQQEVGRPIWMGRLTVVAVVVAPVIAAAMRGSPSGKGTLPTPGTVINAQTGESTTSFQRSTPQNAQIEAGSIFRACDRTTEHPCRWVHGSPAIRVHDGDLIEFGIRLNNGGEPAVPYARLTVALWGGGWTSEGRDAMIAVLDLQYHSGISSGVEEEVKFDAGGGRGYTDINYIPGSTVLQTMNHRLLARLPDGIMDNGIALANIGSPQSCYYCDLKYRRLIFFQARVHQGRG